MKAIRSTVWAVVQLANAGTRGPVDLDAEVRGTCPIDRYEPGCVTAVRDRQSLAHLAALEVALVLVPRDLAEEAAAMAGANNTLLVVDDVSRAMASIEGYIYHDPASGSDR